jgi:hypothetical protein
MVCKSWLLVFLAWKFSQIIGTRMAQWIQILTADIAALFLSFLLRQQYQKINRMLAHKQKIYNADCLQQIVPEKIPASLAITATSFKLDSSVSIYQFHAVFLPVTKCFPELQNGREIVSTTRWLHRSNLKTSSGNQASISYQYSVDVLVPSIIVNELPRFLKNRPEMV